MGHISVLKDEVIEGLNLKKGAIIVDGTFGGGGHSRAVCEALNGEVTIVGLDMDQDAIERCKEMKRVTCNRHCVEDNYRNISEVLQKFGITRVSGIILDLGLSTYQFEESGRGFSFKRNEPLKMTFKRETDPSEFTAHSIINEWDEENIKAVIHGYGEERFAGRIAKRIVEHRKEKSIDTTTELAEIVKNAIPKIFAPKRIHPATKTFQALRIAVNDELGNLRVGLARGFESLEHGGRFAVISFHSLEDRIVKFFFKGKVREGLGTVLTKKPIVPTEEEIEANPASRSAKLRIFEKA